MKLEIGSKLILTSIYSGRYTGITLDVVVKENIKTYSTSKKQLLKRDDYDSIYFNSYDSYNRKRVICDVSGREFNPDRAELFSKNKYNKMVKLMNDFDTNKKAEEDAYNLHKELKAVAFKEYAELEQKMYKEAHPILRDSFIKNMCKSCKNYQSNGTCGRDSDFYNVGLLKDSDKRFFDSMTTMCRWEAK